MHNIALAMHAKGHQVTGSDDAIFEPSKSRLKAKGLLPTQMGWYPDNISSSIDMIVLGMHAKKDNPELLAAQALGLKIVSYPEFLYEQSKDKTRVVIGGSHGKTTITAMILHVLNYHNIEVDYMVGAQLDGFDTMVNLTNDNEFFLLEGDEYLSSPLDLRPKFHHYKPNIALISGIAWDHINVFPTFENYTEQFKIFAESITNGGMLVYNEEDTVLNDLVEGLQHAIKKYPYQTPNHEVVSGQTFLGTAEGLLPLEIFGNHNLNNLAGAKWICQHMGVEEDLFYEAIMSFKGANKRLEKVFDNQSTVVFKDFAHAPSKGKSNRSAVKEQYENHKVLACLELHTYSSLNPVFIDEYKGSLDFADEAWVYFSEEALQIKGLASLDSDQIKAAFGYPNLKVFTNASDFHKALKKRTLKGNGLFIDEFRELWWV